MGVGSAREPAVRPIGVRPGSTTTTERAKSASRYSGLVGTQEQLHALRRAPVVVKRLVALPRKQPVYNLRVDGQPEFFANGVLVHNCDAASYGASLVVTGAMQLATLDREVMGWPRYDQPTWKPGDPLPERSEFADKHLKTELPEVPQPVHVVDDLQAVINRVLEQMEREEEWWDR